MSLENQGQWNKEHLVDSVRFFPEELLKWCEHRGLIVTVPPGWPNEGSIVITRSAKRMEIKMVDPDSCDSFMKLNRVWGLMIENAMGSNALIGRWQESWRSWNRAKIEWNDIDFGEFMGKQLSEYFGVEANSALSPQ